MGVSGVADVPLKDGFFLSTDGVVEDFDFDVVACFSGVIVLLLDVVCLLGVVLAGCFEELALCGDFCFLGVTVVVDGLVSSLVFFEGFEGLVFALSLCSP